MRVYWGTTSLAAGTALLAGSIATTPDDWLLGTIAGVLIVAGGLLLEWRFGGVSR